MRHIRSTTKVTEEISKIPLLGVTIPSMWVERIKDKEGRTNTLAILILADIVFGYTENIEESEDDYTIRIKNRFSGDKLTRSLRWLSKRFGTPEQEIQDTLDFLEEKGLITVEYRDIEVEGVWVSNVIFVEPVPKSISWVSGVSDIFDGLED